MSKISQYSDGGAVQSADKFVISRAGANYSILGSRIAGSGLNISSAAVTTANVTGVEGTLHNLDVSGMTANRDFTLPTPSAAGKRCGVRLSTGDDTYALLLKINAVEWSRIFITDEIVIFVSTGTGAGDWKIEEDGRIPCICKIEATSGQSISNATVTTVTFNQTAFDNAGGQADLVNERISIRRANKYLIGANIDYEQMPANAVRAAMWVNYLGTPSPIHSEASYLSGGYPGFLSSVAIALNVSDTLTMSTYQNSGSPVTTSAYYVPPSLWIKEILPT